MVVLVSGGDCPFYCLIVFGVRSDQIVLGSFQIFFFLYVKCARYNLKKNMINLKFDHARRILVLFA
jgi:hypothetical protein